MKSPYGGRGTKKCCCCDLDPDYTCYLIGSLCLVIFAFGEITLFDSRYMFQFVLTILSFCYYLIAGLCLIIGTLYMSQKAKIIYCWMMLFGIILIFASLICLVADFKEDRAYFMLTSGTSRNFIVISIFFAIKYFVLFFFSFYTPCVVLGNLITYRKVYDGIAIIIISSFVHEERNYFFGNATHLSTTTLVEPDTISPTTMVFNILLLFGCCCGLISSILLIYGLIKDKRMFLIPWILTVLAKSIIDVSHTLYLVMLAAKRLNPIHIVLFTLDFFLLILTIYAFLCVISQYQEYKAGRGRAEDYHVGHPVPYQPPPTATSCLSTRKPGTYHETTATEPHSTLMTNECSLSPCHHSRKTSTKHVQFGISEDHKHVHERRTPENCGRTLDVLMEETSWIQPPMALLRTEPDKKLLLEPDSNPTSKNHF